MTEFGLRISVGFLLSLLIGSIGAIGGLIVWGLQ